MYIELKSTTDITYQLACKFKSVVSISGPQNIILDHTYQSFDSTVTSAFERITPNIIRIHLFRYLTNKEFDNICNGWDAQQFDFQTTISTDQIVPEKNTYGVSIMDDVIYKSIALDLAKSEHAKWYNAKTAQGWSYGAYLSVIDKKHPLMLPWEQLPEDYKTVDLHSPQNMINILQQQGFTLVKTSEFESLINLFKSIQ
jgi:hypothetical protein